MSLVHGRRRAARALFAALALFAGAAHAQQRQKQTRQPERQQQPSLLGRVDFPTSTRSREAQEHFVRGVAALHSFWYEEALDEFRAAAKLDPDFAMAHWGEAMAHNHPLWSEQEAEPARRALGRIKDTSRLTPRERGLVEAVRTLYGEGDKLARDNAYAAAMERLHREHPADLEVASFYSLSLLGTVRQGDRGFSRQVRAGALALWVYEKNPHHPGAAHYIIHSFDDPEHAVLALPAARRYSEIAPAAHHARHMPSHIFIQLGMWPEAAASNESAWKVSTDWVERKGLAMGLRDYHSLHWLHYVYLQQGRYEDAEKLLTAKLRDMEASGYDPRVSRAYVDMAGAYLVETGRWDQAAPLLEALRKIRKGSAAYDDAPATDSCHAAAKAAAPGRSNTAASASQSNGATQTNAAAPSQTSAAASQTEPAAVTRDEAISRMYVLHVFGIAAAQTKNFAAAEKIVAELRTLREAFERAPLGKRLGVLESEVGAMIAAGRGKFDEAIELARRATKFEEELSPPSGPPDFFKPSHELFGEILLQAGKPEEAAEQFAVSLQRQPNRARSLLGRARAAAAAKDDAAAASAYRELLRHWQRADPSLAELREARSFVEQARGGN
jgi:tetratricopeptide (TPR) repeat protein